MLLCNFKTKLRALVKISEEQKYYRFIFKLLQLLLEILRFHSSFTTLSLKNIIYSLSLYSQYQISKQIKIKTIS